MKKFRFQFESVLKMRRHKRSLCRQLLGEILQADQRLVEESRRLDALRQGQIQEIRQRQEPGRLDIDAGANLRSYVGQLQAQLRTVQANRRLLEKQLTACRQALAKAEQEVKAMEKLSDKHREAFQFAQIRKESLELEETWAATQQSGGLR
jgi:flagellar export protein FliJ